MLNRIVVPAALLGLSLGCGAEPDASPRCGDGIVQDDEACDDRNAVEGDGCNTDCKVSGSLQWCVEVRLPENRTVYPVSSYAFDGGVLVVTSSDAKDGSGDDVAWLIALDSSGEQLWERAVSVPSAENFNPSNLVAGADASTVVFAATIYPKGVIGSDAWLGEVDLATGDLVRERRYVDPINRLSVSGVTRTEQGLLLHGAAVPDAWIAQLDGDWNIVWDRRFDYEGEEDAVASVLPLANGDLAVVGVARSAIDTLDLPPYEYLFYRVYDPDGNLEIDVTPAGTGPEETSFGGAVPWKEHVLIADPALSHAKAGPFWRLNADGQHTEPGTSFEEGRRAWSLAARPEVVFTGGTTPKAASYGLRWLARLTPDLRSVAWEYVGAVGSVESIAAATDEPALYASIWLSRPMGGSDADICKFSE